MTEVTNFQLFILDERPVMYETDFLQDIAEQNYRKYNIHVKKHHEVQVNSLNSNLYYLMS